jgi:hypothetical protein
MYDEGPRFLLGDPRNDEDTIVSQLQGLFLRFHNRIIKDHPAIDPQADFSQIQKLVRFQYRTWCSMTFCRHHSLHRVERSENRRWKIRPAQASVLPLEGKVEFSVAAYRLGHSIIRPGYGLNDHDFTLLPIFPAPSQGLPEGLTGFCALLPHFGISTGGVSSTSSCALLATTTPPNSDSKRRLQVRISHRYLRRKPGLYAPEIPGAGPAAVSAAVQPRPLV